MKERSPFASPKAKIRCWIIQDMNSNGDIIAVKSSLEKVYEFLTKTGKPYMRSGNVDAGKSINSYDHLHKTLSRNGMCLELTVALPGVIIGKYRMKRYELE